MALERVDHRLVGLLVDLGDDPAEVADRLMVVEGQGQRDAPNHAASRQPASVTAVATTGSMTGTPAAGR